MQQCEFCRAQCASQDAYHLHLGIGAPAFHECNTPDEMKAKGMTQNRASAWSIDPSLIVHHQGWASLRSDWTPGHLLAERQR